MDGVVDRWAHGAGHANMRADQGLVVGGEPDGLSIRVGEEGKAILARFRAQEQ